jgi:ribosomal protein L7/L12
MISKEEAKSKVIDLITGSVAGMELVVVDDSTIERDWGWVFFYSSKKWIETGDIQYALGGNAPYIVNRFDGSIHETGTAHSIEHYIDIYEGNVPENKQIVITGWSGGFEKIECTKLIRDRMELGLTESKKITDSILEGQTITLKPKQEIEEFQKALSEIKAISHIEKIREPVSGHNSGGCAPSA